MLLSTGVGSSKAGAYPTHLTINRQTLKWELQVLLYEDAALASAILAPVLSEVIFGKYYMKTRSSSGNNSWKVSESGE